MPWFWEPPVQSLHKCPGQAASPDLSAACAYLSDHYACKKYPIPRLPRPMSLHLMSGNPTACQPADPGSGGGRLWLRSPHPPLTQAWWLWHLGQMVVKVEEWLPYILEWKTRVEVLRRILRKDHSPGEFIHISDPLEDLDEQRMRLKYEACN